MCWLFSKALLVYKSPFIILSRIWNRCLKTSGRKRDQGARNAARGDQQRCVGNESTPGSSATVKQFNCNLCRIKHGAPCTIKFKDTGTCSRCREGCNDEYLRCKICGQCECAACSAATSIELDQSAKMRKAKRGQGKGMYTCLACCCAPKGTVAVAEGTQAAHGLGKEMDRVIN